MFKEIDLSLLQARAQADDLSEEELIQIVRTLRANRFAAMQAPASKPKATSAKPKLDSSVLMGAILKGANK